MTWRFVVPCNKGMDFFIYLKKACLPEEIIIIAFNQNLVRFIFFQVQPLNLKYLCILKLVYL